MEDLIDIQGLDAIGNWPLAFGWWVVIIASIALLVSLTIYTWRYIKYRRSWQIKAYRKLEALRLDIGQTDLKLILQSLSVQLRKIAMQTTQREACASLSGKQWLNWLETNDPHGYAWSKHGMLLVNAQYMPATTDLEVEHVTDLIRAAQGWVKTC